MQIKILLVLGVLVCLISSTPCSDLINKIISDPTEHTQQLVPMILYSGMGPNYPGQFAECNNISNFKYYLAYQSPDFTESTNASSQDLLGYFTGFCLPNYCTKEDIQSIPIFRKLEVYDYDHDSMNVLAWMGLVSFLIYILIILVAIVLSMTKKYKTVEITQGRLSIQDDDKQINPSLTTQSLSQPLMSRNQQSSSNSTFVQSFNAYKNYNKIFQTNPIRNILYGPKCIAVLMIIVAFEYSYRQTVALNHKTAATLLSKSLGYFITNVQLAFATLFWIFGVSAAYALYKIQSPRDVFRGILNKFLKLWPVLVLYIIFSYGITQLIIERPLNQLWEILYNNNCTSIFWRKLLLVNTLIKDDKSCLPWTWIFQVEILLYVFAPLFILVHRSKKWLGYLLLVLVILGSMIYSFVILEAQKIPFYPSLLFNNTHSFVFDFQMHPLTRASQFYFGLLLGIFINHALDKVDDSSKRPSEHAIFRLLKRSRVHQWIFQLFGLAFICTSFFLIVRVQDSDSRSTFIRVFIVLIPLVMLLGLSLLVLPSFFSGRGHLTMAINYLLGSSFWSPLYKLSNSVYLTAPIIIGLMTYSLQNGIYYSYEEISLLFLGDLAIILFFSILVCCCLEMPFNTLQQGIQSRMFGQKLNQSIVELES